MNRLFQNHIYVIVIALILVSCEDEVNPNIKNSEPIFTVDAWLNHVDQTQKIFLSQSTDYFNNSSLPKGIVGAEVVIIDEDGVQYQFIDQGDGSYKWNSGVEGTGFGEIGKRYDLSIKVNATTYTSQTVLKPTTSVDSVYFVNDEDPFEGEFIRADFLARDLSTPGDTYWIKSFKNDVLLNKASEINIAFDAGFGEGGGEDQNGAIFIPPLRFAINDFEELPIYEKGDVVRVEIHSISYEAFRFLNLVAFQSNRAAGLDALFESPLNNVSTNIVSSDPDEYVIGIFNIADVSSKQAKLVEKDALPVGCFIGYDDNEQPVKMCP